MSPPHRRDTAPRAAEWATGDIDAEHLDDLDCDVSATVLRGVGLPSRDEANPIRQIEQVL